jgi:hypothetical protein
MRSTMFVFMASGLLGQGVSAQVYHPMPTDGATWTVVEYGYGTLPPETGVWHFGAMGDTLIDGQTYTRLYCNCGTLGMVNPEAGFNAATAIYYGAYREDSSKKVWFRDATATTDRLYFDFALDLGDTFCFPMQPCGISCFEVTLVDQVQVGSDMRRQIHFAHNGQEEVWIEGIGSITDQWTGEWCFSGNIGWQLNCFSEENVVVYGPCDFPTSVVDPHGPDDHLEVFPNPSKGSFRVMTPHATNFQFALFDMMGRPVMTGNGSSGNMLTMDVPSGIYLLRVQTPDGVYAHRIIRE